MMGICITLYRENKRVAIGLEDKKAIVAEVREAATNALSAVVAD